MYVLKRAQESDFRARLRADLNLHADVTPQNKNFCSQPFLNELGFSVKIEGSFMAQMIELNTPLPGFRQDLKVYKGPDEPDGSPTYNLQDPVKGKYFQLTWAEHLIYQRLRPGVTVEGLVQDLNTTTTLRVSGEEVGKFLTDCFRFGLLSTPVPSEQLFNQKKQQKKSVFIWLLYNYLFMRIPLFNPDSFLTRTLPYVKWLGSTTAFLFYCLIGATGLLLLFMKFGEFVNNFSFFFNLEGFLDYFFAISTVKIIHEFSHAYTAKRYGIYVPSMGIALIVLWPVLYTDVTDGWKLSSRRQRIYISAAGVIAETIIAGVCTIGWAATQPGVLNNIFFVIASVTWVSTLAINLNPAIRFDGYYILSDLWGVDNLQQRTFSVARWKFREIFLGIVTPCPEPRLPRRQLLGFVAYAVYTWIYRLFLYTAIAIFVYHTFTKALGIFLFFVEIGIFILWPIAWEIQDLTHIKEKITINPRLIATLSTIGLFLGWAILPLPHTEVFPGVIVPLNQQTIYTPADSLVRQLSVKRDDIVRKGQILAKLDSPSLIFQLHSIEADLQIAKKQLDLIREDDEQRSYLLSKQAELSSLEEKLAGFKDLQDELTIKANVDGKLFSWSEYLRVGLAVPKDFILGKIADPKDVEVIFFVPEEYLDVVKEGAAVKFRILSTHEELSGVISRINPIRPQNLEYPALASLYKGEVAVNQEAEGGKLKIIEAYYTVHVHLDPTTSQPLFGKSGEVEVRGPWRSKFMVLIRAIARILWREGSL